MYYTLYSKQCGIIQEILNNNILRVDSLAEMLLCIGNHVHGELKEMFLTKLLLNLNGKS